MVTGFYVPETMWTVHDPPRRRARQECVWDCRRTTYGCFRGVLYSKWYAGADKAADRRRVRIAHVKRSTATCCGQFAARPIAQLAGRCVAHGLEQRHDGLYASEPISVDMIDFLAQQPTLDASWRSVVLFGRNVASYKFALAKTLLGMADRPDDRVPLEELASSFARHLCEHLARVEKQTTSRSSKFLDACRSFNRGELTEDRLTETTVKLSFNNVIGAFHVVGPGPVSVRFFSDERSSGGPAAIRITDDLRSLASSTQGSALGEEAEARWRQVETAWALDLPRAGVAVQADVEQGLLFVERVRRVNLTGVRPALNGYQRGRCFYCNTETTLAASDVDHFFPGILKERGFMPDADGVWNLVLACKDCNRGAGGKFACVPSARLIARLHERNNWLVDSHHPLRETIMLQTGQEIEARASYLRSRQRIASGLPVWDPA